MSMLDSGVIEGFYGRAWTEASASRCWTGSPTRA